MGSIPSDFPISLRAAAPSKAATEASALPTLIQRINFERGSFRDISEESLRQEIIEAEAGTSTDAGDGTIDVDEGDEDKPGRLKEIANTREEILGQIEYVSRFPRREQS